MLIYKLMKELKSKKFRREDLSCLTHSYLNDFAVKHNISKEEMLDNFLEWLNLEAINNTRYIEEQIKWNQW